MTQEWAKFRTLLWIMSIVCLGGWGSQSQKIEKRESENDKKIKRTGKGRDAQWIYANKNMCIYIYIQNLFLTASLLLLP